MLFYKLTSRHLMDYGIYVCNTQPAATRALGQHSAVESLEMSKPANRARPAGDHLGGKRGRRSVTRRRPTRTPSFARKNSGGSDAALSRRSSPCHICLSQISR